ncbi:hypothetical protein [Streptomyces tagetis]|uniref:Uncharacterized protein n=1 Tax=Streptomyces tagetis TaxID=2820809 RepID=A0A941B3P4_9ACTN|nr:hypothetical protein [Streptomyces sp. RG38]MBQ0828447.1 hypothetical protein [Streptomyces sp. RG38]
MEQRIGPSIQPLTGAAADPAFVPGITGPATPQDAKPTEEAEPREAVPKPGEADDTAPAPAAAADPADDPADSADAPGEDGTPEAEPVDGPVFEAADRRARITADHRGVRLALDDQECEFRWDEIGAVETETPRFGKRFTVTVHTPDRRWYPIEIDADSRGRFAQWESDLDAVLDAYFDDGEESGEPEPEPEPDTAEAPEDVVDAEDTKDAEDSKAAEAAEAAEAAKDPEETASAKE